eukprot:TRINITY_DN12649_c0_g1_i1.p1 TRINITY_DN12649_c0_g1~~TRINITY_DN12649_c0_g1_i1.p1  ORF type:complete len:975 (-),score=165.36 TRINITY_DN12649_c0_g1_i1:290-3214(-)
MAQWFSDSVVPAEAVQSWQEEVAVSKRVSKSSRDRRPSSCSNEESCASPTRKKKQTTFADSVPGATDSEPSDVSPAQKGSQGDTKPRSSIAVPLDDVLRMHLQSVSKTQRPEGLHGFKYFFFCLSACTAVSGLAMTLWSSMGWGERGIEFLINRAHLVSPCAATSGTLLLFLYLLDCFSPPHLADRYLALFKDDYCVARFVFVIAFSAFLAAIFLSAKRYPSIPLVMTVFLSPVFIAVIRSLSRPKDPHTWVDSLDRLNHVQAQDQLTLMELLIGHERDTRYFYGAASSALGLSSVACLVAWIAWALRQEGLYVPKYGEESLSTINAEALYICWAAPLITSLSHLMFGAIVFFRFTISKHYDATSELKNELVIRLRTKQYVVADGRVEKSDSDASHASCEREQLVARKEQYIRQLSLLVKIVGCALIFMLGVFYVASELVAADSHIAQMVQGFLGAFFLAFMCIVLSSLRRLYFAMKDWLKVLPLWRMGLKLLKWDWTKAVVVCIIMPLIPVVFLLSALNQKVRCSRKIYQKIQPVEQGDPVSPKLERASSELSAYSWIGGFSVAGAPEDHILTIRVRKHLMMVATWDWLEITKKVYIVGGCFVLYTITPRLLNVFLSWLGSMMQELPFWLIIIFVFFIGLVCFLLPPVPGVSVYLFAGVVTAQTCPYDFWTGVLICITLCWVLKMTACAVQQKLIGEKLGDSVWVRQQVGVHKPVIRAIEAVLREPGWTMGKVAILCGGPDWPTSVGAGLLRLSVLQMEIGTVPIVLFVAPCTMCGSFYIRRDESELWNRLANLMIMFTMFLNMILWIGAAWAVQEQLDRHHAEFTRPLEQHLELDWRDFCEYEIHRRCHVVDEDVPRMVRLAYLSGAVAIVFVGQVFYWRSSACFGSFKVTDDIYELQWLGPQALCKMPGLIGLVIASVSLLGLAAFRRWCLAKQMTPSVEVHRELRALEASWKKKRLEEVHVRHRSEELAQ